MLPADCRRQRGFTLIEVMVALAVFSLAALALIRLEGATTRGVATIDETLIAGLVARNIAVDAMSEGRAPATGTSSGIESAGGRLWRWTRTVRPTGDRRILRIDVAVAAPTGRIAGRTTMVRPPDAPPLTAPVPSPTSTPVGAR